MTSWSFTIGSSPVITNKSPAPDEKNVDNETLIIFDVYDKETFVRPNEINAYVNGALAYDGYSFISPFNGVDSYFGGIVVDGYDGYRVVIDSTNRYENIVQVRALADDYAENLTDETWSFIIGEDINVLYFSDGYGLKAVNQSALVGEAQSQVRTLFETPQISSNNLSSIYGTRVNDDNYLVISYDNYGSTGYGATIIRNEAALNTYANGYNVDKSQLTDDGTLYLINKDENRVEVYYGATERSGSGRSPDYIYDLNSSPNILSGEILELYLVENGSPIASGATRLYIGSAKGMTRLDTNDSSTDGYSDGYEGYGISSTYTISGGGGDYAILGGTVPNVVSITSDEDNDVVIVATTDGLGNGGVSQINTSSNKRLIFMNEDSGLIHSNNIADVNIME